MIKVENLSYHYPGKKDLAVKEANFNVNAGEVFGFLGPSGAGKSTTQKILIGLLQGYQGSVKIDEQEVSQKNSRFYEEIGVAFEVPNLYSKFTARENLKFFSSLYAGQCEAPDQLLARLNLLADAEKRVSTFSKGMRGRLNLCRALLNKPRLLFLDEPTSGLDPVNARLVKELVLEKKKEGCCVFLTTHNMKVAEDVCDRLAFMVDGKLIAIDSPRAFKLAAGKARVSVEYREENNLKSAEFKLDNIGQNQDFLKLLSEKKIETMHSREADLEDVFIQKTGRRLQ